MFMAAGGPVGTLLVIYIFLIAIQNVVVVREFS